MEMETEDITTPQESRTKCYPTSQPQDKRHTLFYCS